MRQNKINHRAVGFFGPFYYNEVKNGKIRTFTVQFFKLFKLREENLFNLKICTLVWEAVKNVLAEFVR